MLCSSSWLVSSNPIAMFAFACVVAMPVLVYLSILTTQTSDCEYQDRRRDTQQTPSSIVLTTERRMTISVIAERWGLRHGVREDPDTLHVHRQCPSFDICASSHLLRRCCRSCSTLLLHNSSHTIQMWQSRPVSKQPSKMSVYVIQQWFGVRPIMTSSCTAHHLP